MMVVSFAEYESVRCSNESWSIVEYVNFLLLEYRLTIAYNLLIAYKVLKENKYR